MIATDEKIQAALDEFSTSVGQLVAKRDGSVMAEKLAEMRSLMSGGKAAKPAKKGEEPKPQADLELKALTAKLHTNLSALLTERSLEVVSSRFDLLEQQLLNPAGPSLFRPPRLAAKPRTGAPTASGGDRATTPPKQCPVPNCGLHNTARRYSYLCESHRTPENLARFRAKK